MENNAGSDSGYDSSPVSVMEGLLLSGLSYVTYSQLAELLNHLLKSQGLLNSAKTALNSTRCQALGISAGIEKERYVVECLLSKCTINPTAKKEVSLFFFDVTQIRGNSKPLWAYFLPNNIFIKRYKKKKEG